MKKYLRWLVVVCSMIALVGCGGGESGGDPVTSESESVVQATEEVEAVAMAITRIVQDVSQSIDATSAFSTYRVLKTLKANKDVIGTAEGTGSGSCEFSAGGFSDLNTDPMTFELSGQLSCNAYKAMIVLPERTSEVRLDGSISLTMRGSIAQNHSSEDLRFSMEWSSLRITIGGGSYRDISGTYTLTLVGSDGELTIAGEGVIDEQSISQADTIALTYSTGVYDEFSDAWVVYKNSFLYHGDYWKDTSINPDTCSNNLFPYVWPARMNIAELDGSSLSFVDNDLTTVFEYDSDFPHFDQEDMLTYWYNEPAFSCLVMLGSLPSMSTTGYEDVLIFACSDGVDVCGLTYTRDNNDTTKTVGRGSSSILNDDIIKKRANELMEDAKEKVLNP